MTELTSAERRARGVIIGNIRRTTEPGPSDPFRALMTYGQLCTAADPDQMIWRYPRYRGIGKALLHIGAYEAEHGRPLPNALVVRQSGKVGDGFIPAARDCGFEIPETADAEKAFWRKQVEEAVRYWMDHEDPEAMTAPVPGPLERARAMLGTVMEELAEIRQLIETA